MKELTIEQKAAAYDKALGRAKELLEIGLKDTRDKRVVLSFFPELKEDEDGDEKTRKDIVFYIAANHKDDGEKARWLYWLEKQGDKSVNIDIESMVSSYKQRLKSQGGIENSPLVNMCLTAFRRGVENTLEELNLKKLEKKGEHESITFNNAHIIDSALNDYCCKQYDALHKENGGVLSFARLQHLAMDIYGWCKKQGEQNPEYVRKDAFVEKACEWLEERMIGWNNDFVEDFRNYMKGE